MWLRIILFYKTWLKLLLVDLNLRVDPAKNVLQKSINIHQNEALGLQSIKAPKIPGARGRHYTMSSRIRCKLAASEEEAGGLECFLLESSLVPDLSVFSPNLYHSIKLPISSVFHLFQITPRGSSLFPKTLVFLRYEPLITKMNYISFLMFWIACFP